MQPAYYEEFRRNKEEISGLMLDDAVTNRGSQFRIPTVYYVVLSQMNLMEELLFLENQIEQII